MTNNLENNKKTSTISYKEAVIKLAKKVKKEHFLKIILWSVGITLSLIWLAFLIATSISTGERIILGNDIYSVSGKEVNSFLNKHYEVVGLVVSDTGLIESIEFKEVLARVDYNPLCLTYDANLTGYYLLIVLAPAGYLGIIYIIAYMKNLITPQQVKKVVRQALMFGYLQQKDVTYVCNEIDYNIGIKERPIENNNQIEEDKTEMRIETYETKEQPKQETTKRQYY